MFRLRWAPQSVAQRWFRDLRNRPFCPAFKVTRFRLYFHRLFRNEGERSEVRDQKGGLPRHSTATEGVGRRWIGRSADDAKILAAFGCVELTSSKGLLDPPFEMASGPPSYDFGAASTDALQFPLLDVRRFL